MRGIKIAVAAVLVILVVVVAWGLYGYYGTVDLGDRVVTVIVQTGDTFESVAERIIDRGVVRSRMMLVYPARLRNIDRKLTPGRYDFTGRNSCRSVLRKLEDADFVRIRVTVPEGSTVWDVAAIMRSKLDLDSAAFVGLSNDSVFLLRLGVPCLEGRLYPETYFFPWGMTAEQVVIEMYEAFRGHTDSMLVGDLPLGLSPADIIKLASIIEAETRLDSERTLVASVYLNRLERNMKLDADPTVIYGLGGLKRPLLRRDLSRETPYNTYIHKGLPPTPINSPGLAAIAAAANPAETEYLYFVADNTGGHQFSRTNAEHNRAKRRIRQARESGG